MKGNRNLRDGGIVLVGRTMHNRNCNTMAGHRSMRRMHAYNEVLLMVIAVIALMFIHNVDADVPFLSGTAAAFSKQQGRCLLQMQNRQEYRHRLQTHRQDCLD